MKYNKTTLLTIIFVSSFYFLGFTHERHSDPVLQELNDYMMAIQMLRTDDARASEIFKSWQELRKASWKIREVMEEKELDIDATDIMELISKARAKRQQLLTDCKSYFADIISREQAVKFHVDKVIQVEWNNPIFEVQVHHSKVILIEIQNHRNSSAQITMKSNLSDEILFWNKHFKMEAGSTRFTFAVLSPLNERLNVNSIKITDDSKNIGSASLRVQGIPMEEKPYALAPGRNMYKVSFPNSDNPNTINNEKIDKEIKFNITDAKDGEPLAARVHVWDAEGKAYWNPISGPSYSVFTTEGGWHKTSLWKNQPGPYFYVKGEVSLGVDPSNKTAKIFHGFEYKPKIIQINEDGVVNISLDRWINMPELGWYSGQTHIHTTDTGMPVQFNKHWPLVAYAEDLHVSEILTLKGEWDTHAIYANEYPMGKREAFSTSNYLINYGEEYRNNPYGHLALIGLDYLIQPISSGALGELAGADYPPNAFILDEALDQGALTIGAHFGSYIGKGKEIKTPWPSTGFEMPVDVALGKIQLAEIYGAGGKLDVWYDLLNCGFRIPATAGPDWALKDTPRVYVFLGEKPFTLNNWRDGLRKGQSFITKGPMIFFEVNSQKPGSTINVKNGIVQLNIKSNALNINGEQPVEIIFNGKVIAEGTNLDTTITVTDSGWIAAKTKDAHSNPVFINYNGRPAGNAAPAKKFIKITDNLIEWVNTKALFDSNLQKEEMLNVLKEGKTVYENIIIRANKLGRE